MANLFLGEIWAKFEVLINICTQICNSVHLKSWNKKICLCWTKLGGQLISLIHVAKFKNSLCWTELSGQLIHVPKFQNSLGWTKVANWLLYKSPTQNFKIHSLLDQSGQQISLRGEDLARGRKGELQHCLGWSTGVGGPCLVIHDIVTWSKQLALTEVYISDYCMIV